MNPSWGRSDLRARLGWLLVGVLLGVILILLGSLVWDTLTSSPILPPWGG